jgi:hypothetical protein
MQKVPLHGARSRSVVDCGLDKPIESPGGSFEGTTTRGSTVMSWTRQEPIATRGTVALRACRGLKTSSPTAVYSHGRAWCRVGPMTNLSTGMRVAAAVAAAAVVQVMTDVLERTEGSLAGGAAGGASAAARSDASRRTHLGWRGLDRTRLSTSGRRRRTRRCVMTMNEEASSAVWDLLCFGCLIPAAT